MDSFETLFGVPREHRLELVRSRSRGGTSRGEYCSHEEFDSRGRLVARYETFSELDPSTGRLKSGWIRYSADGASSVRSEDVRGLVSAF